MFGELVKIAFASLAGSKLRTALSTLGIVIGIASVVAISNFGLSATASIKSEVSSQGLGILTIVPGRDAGKETERIFVRDLCGEVLASVQGIDAVLPVNSERLDVRAGGKSYSTEILAVESGFFPLFGLEASGGACLSPRDGEEAASVAVVGDELAASLFGDSDPTGSFLKIVGEGGARSLRIAGRLKTRDSSQGIDFDASAFIPYETFKARFRRTDRVQRYLVVVSAGSDSLAVTAELKAFLARRTGNPDSFRVMSPASLSAMLTGITSTLSVFLLAVAAISLLVGGVGIMNIMLVSVTERTREIGIRKALGASAGRVMAQFVIEAVVLTLTGGVLGAALGVGLSYFATTALGWQFSLSASSIGVAIAFSSLVGLFFGWYPAARAAALDPVAALMHE